MGERTSQRGVDLELNNEHLVIMCYWTLQQEGKLLYFILSALLQKCCDNQISLPFWGI